jgi:hypothetical protein
MGAVKAKPKDQRTNKNQKPIDRPTLNSHGKPSDPSPETAIGIIAWKDADEDCLCDLLNHGCSYFVVIMLV